MKYLLLLLFTLSIGMSRAQSPTFSGTVISASLQQPLANASVLLLRRGDSTLTQYTRSNAQGQYQFSNVAKGSYILICSYPQYADFYDTLSFSEGPSRTQDTIKLISKAEALQEIIIKKYKGGIRLSGDTTEYLADFFKTNPGATVEDLLKKLPGIQINNKGEISAQGQKVKQILVDGEEFFPDDPTIATKYLRADMIDKVQVYDQRDDTLSKNEEDKVKTLNLTLKADKKKGYFGKLEGASDFSKYSNENLFAGYFNKKLKTAGYIKNSNFENSALGWSDGKQFGGVASGGYYNQDDGGYYSYNSSNFNDQVDSRGIPNNTSGGIAYNNSLDSGKIKITSSYRFAHEGNTGTIRENSRYFLPDTSYAIKDSTSNRSTQDGHRLNLKANFKLDSLNTLNVEINGSANSGNSNSWLQSGTSASRDINNTIRDLSLKTDKASLTGSINWQRNYRKKGRSLSTSLSSSWLPSRSDQNMVSDNTIYLEAGNSKTVHIDQLKQSNLSNLNASFNLTYGDRINKYFTWSAGYAFNAISNRNRIHTYNREAGGLSSVIDSLSNDFDFLQLKNTATYTLRYARKKWNYWGTLSGGTSTYSQQNYTKNTTQNRTFYNFFPRTGFTYSWKKQSSVQLYYNGNTSAPSINQLQPVVNNSDPFDITVGNSKLVQSFNHSMTVYLHNYQTLKGRYLFGYLSANIPRNTFVSSTTIDSNGIRRTQTVNANGNYSFDLNLDYNMDFQGSPVDLSFSLSPSVDRNVMFSNGVRVNTESSSMEGEVNLGLDLDFLYIYFGYSLSYNQSRNNLPGNKGTSYFLKTPSYDIQINLPGNFRIYGSGEFNKRPATAVFTKARNVYYLTAGLGKYFGKKRDFELGFYMNDILNQNVGFNRDISTNVVSEQLYTQLSRYWLLKFRWNFASAGGAPK